jgi:hypothetical protein
VNELCAYCGERTAATDDHIFARGFFPENVGSNIERWTVRSCDECNNRFSQMEGRVIRYIASSLDPKNPASAGVWDRVKRSIDPDKARNEKDRAMRERTRSAFYSSLAEIDHIPEQGVLPSFRDNFEQGSRMMVKISAADLNGTIEKWARGVHYKTTARTLTRDNQIEVLHFDTVGEDEVLKPIRKRATRLEPGPGVEVLQLIAGGPNDGYRTWYEFRVWEQFTVFASVVEEPPLQP